MGKHLQKRHCSHGKFGGFVQTWRQNGTVLRLCSIANGLCLWAAYAVMCLILFFRKELRRCPSLRGKRLKNLSRILLRHIILKTGHYGTSADNDLSLYLPCLPGPPGLYFKHAWIRGRGLLFYLVSMHHSLIRVYKWPHFGAEQNVK